MDSPLQVNFAGECQYLNVTIRLYKHECDVYVKSSDFLKLGIVSAISSQLAYCKRHGETSITKLSTACSVTKNTFMKCVDASVVPAVTDYVGEILKHATRRKIYKTVDGAIYINDGKHNDLQERIGVYIDGRYSTAMAFSLACANLTSDIIREIQCLIDSVTVSHIVSKHMSKLNYLTTTKSPQESCPDIRIYVDDNDQLYLEYAAAVATLHSSGFREFMPCVCVNDNVVMPVIAFCNLYPDSKKPRELINDALIKKCLHGSTGLSEQLHGMVDGWLSRSKSDSTQYDFMKDCSRWVDLLEMNTGFKISLS